MHPILCPDRSCCWDTGHISQIGRYLSRRSLISYCLLDLAAGLREISQYSQMAHTRAFSWLKKSSCVAFDKSTVKFCEVRLTALHSLPFPTQICVTCGVWMQCPLQRQLQPPPGRFSCWLLASRAWLSGSRLARAALGCLLVVSSPDSRPGPGGGSHGLTSHQDRRGNHTEQHFSGSCSSIYR